MSPSSPTQSPERTSCTGSYRRTEQVQGDSQDGTIMFISVCVNLSVDQNHLWVSLNRRGVTVWIRASSCRSHDDVSCESWGATPPWLHPQLSSPPVNRSESLILTAERRRTSWSASHFIIFNQSNFIHSQERTKQRDVDQLIINMCRAL